MGKEVSLKKKKKKANARLNQKNERNEHAAQSFGISKLKLLCIAPSPKVSL